MKNVRLLTHSSILIEGSKKIYIDPFQIKETKKDADIICVTHDHYDHFSIEDILKVMNEETIFVAPYSLLNKMPGKNVIYLKPFESIDIKGVRIEARPSYNKNKRFHPKDNNWLGFLISLDDVSYYIVGDSDALEENLNLHVDVLLVPIGGTYTMNYLEASEFTNKLKPKIVIPTHYGSVVGSNDLGERFASQIDNNIKVEIIKEY